MAMKRNGKSLVSSDSDEKVVFFKDRFQLIHFWEARNPVKKTLIGLEMLLIDEQGTVIQGFIPPGRIKKYLPDMNQGSVYKLNNFYGSKNKPVYRVADHIATVSFTWNSEMTVLHDIPIHFDEDRFRFHSYEDFEANCDLRGDLYDFVGHMKLVNGQTLTKRPILDEVEIATTRHVLVHVQSHDGPVRLPRPQKKLANEEQLIRHVRQAFHVNFIQSRASNKIISFLHTKTLEPLKPQAMAMKRNGKSHVSSDSDEKVVFFKDVSLGTVIQGFIPSGRIKKYLPDMNQGSVYKLNNFYRSKNKPVYRVADHIATVSFTWNSEMTVLHDIPIHFDEDRFRFHSYEDFEANCDLRGDLYGKLFNLASNLLVKLLYVLMWVPSCLDKEM
ncbi:BnaC03g41440D [Brassica napus]|uniref:(rape) hypothetical protein n=1 Tax=Brassica napus TaxID=3708 RepID=A0A078HF85_BRANA|nr:unnamed protein product [Brassica napus]CDY36054.1 BnaC03g41440D [Brassica napus]